MKVAIIIFSVVIVLLLLKKGKTARVLCVLTEVFTLIGAVSVTVLSKTSDYIDASFYTIVMVAFAIILIVCVLLIFFAEVCDKSVVDDVLPDDVEMISNIPKTESIDNVNRISLEQANKLAYKVGEPFDLSKYVIRVYYKNGKIEDVVCDDERITLKSNFNPDKAGDYYFIFQMGGCQTEPEPFVVSDDY